MEESNAINILPELLEEILIRLPVKSILRFRTVSKQWRSILESRSFTERHTSLPKRRRILAAFNCNCHALPSLLPETRHEDVVYLHCDAEKPSMTCDGLICFPQKDWFLVFNPSTSQLRRFPSGLNHLCISGIRLWSTFYPENWAMGFGRDKISGMYKVVRMCFCFWEIGKLDPSVDCSVLDVQTGQWRKLNRPLDAVNPGSQSVCVNGSIYWLYGHKILALDLHREEFHNVPIPPTESTPDTQIVNFEERLAYAITSVGILEIWSMDNTYSEQWSKTYSISLQHSVAWFKPVLVTMQGDLVFHDNKKRVFKYYPRSDKIRCLSKNTCVISPYLENLVMLPLKPSHRHPPLQVNSGFKCRLFRAPKSWISKVLKRDVGILDVVFASLVVIGYILLPL